MSSLICSWKNRWLNNREAGDLIWHRTHYDVTVIINMLMDTWIFTPIIVFHIRPVKDNHGVRFSINISLDQYNNALYKDGLNFIIIMGIALYRKTIFILKCTNIKTAFPQCPIIRIRRLWDRPVFTMGIPMLVRRHIHIELPPCAYQKGENRSRCRSSFDWWRQSKHWGVYLSPWFIGSSGLCTRLR